jgi:paraquat-inducible protein A
LVKVARVLPTSTKLMICPDCDSVHRLVPLGSGEVACCMCCDAVLARRRGLQVNEVLALTVAAAILFVIANVTPVLTIEVGGMHTEANISTAALSMDSGWISGAALVLAATTFLVPLLQISLLLWLLAFSSAARRVPGFRIVLVALHRLRPWSMTEVFLLGALVAIVKLSSWVRVVPGDGIWALAGLTIILTILSRVDPRAWWNLAERPES